MTSPWRIGYYPRGGTGWRYNIHCIRWLHCCCTLRRNPSWKIANSTSITSRRRRVFFLFSYWDLRNHIFIVVHDGGGGDEGRKETEHGKEKIDSGFRTDRLDSGHRVSSSTTTTISSQKIYPLLSSGFACPRKLTADYLKNASTNRN